MIRCADARRWSDEVTPQGEDQSPKPPEGTEDQPPAEGAEAETSAESAPEPAADTDAGSEAEAHEAETSEGEGTEAAPEPAADADTSPDSKTETGEGEDEDEDEDATTTGESDPAADALLQPMVRVCGVRFPASVRVQELVCDGVSLSLGSNVVAEGERGQQLGAVATSPREVPGRAGSRRRVLRLARPTDLRQGHSNRRKEEEAYTFCVECINTYKLEMKLIRVEYLHTGSKAIFYFASEGRIDFRDLVRDLAQRFRIRVEMRQVGVRDAARMTGGLGTCGRELCCSTHLTRFEPVSIRMAKSQNLALNPQKVSGACGRLLCCLAFEHSTYKELSKGLPKMNKRVMTSRGVGKVRELDTLRRRIKVYVDGGMHTFTDDEFRPLTQEEAQAAAAGDRVETDPELAAVVRAKDEAAKPVMPEPPATRERPRESQLESRGRGGRGRDSRSRGGAPREGKQPDGKEHGAPTGDANVRDGEERDGKGRDGKSRGGRGRGGRGRGGQRRVAQPRQEQKSGQADSESKAGGAPQGRAADGQAADGQAAAQGGEDQPSKSRRRKRGRRRRGRGRGGSGQGSGEGQGSGGDSGGDSGGGSGGDSGGGSGGSSPSS